MDSPPQEPQRLSALYQYHNAPEVAPAHGLEYDDNVYPVSDKYPVTHETPSYDPRNYRGKHAFVSDNRPPRILFGMKLKTFFVVATVMVLVVVGAAVGGAVGGKSVRNNESKDGMALMNSNATTATSTTSTASATTATFTAATPTYMPLSDCPASNNTNYTSEYSSGQSDSTPDNAGLTFTKYCGLSSPLSLNGASKIAEAFVYSFSDCIEICAGYNFWNSGSNCTFAVYQPNAARPGNCVLGADDKIKLTDLSIENGTDVALLDS